MPNPAPDSSTRHSPAAIYRGGLLGEVSALRREVEYWLTAACGSEAEPPLIVTIGLAEGRLLDLLDERASDTRVLAIEPDPAMAAACRGRGRTQTWINTGRLCHLVGPDYAGANDAWRFFPSETCKLMVHPRLELAHPASVESARIAKQIIFGVRANAEARRRFAPRYLTNVLRNIPRIAAGRDVRTIAGRFQGVPALIAGAGPSLDAALALLPTLRDRALFIACDTALRPLLSADLAPHLVVGADPGAANARHFRGLPDCPDTWLVAESALDPSTGRLFGDRTFWFQLSGHHPWPWLNSLGLDLGRVDMWGSVLTAAFQVACLAGCDPIILVGADLAFTGGRPYGRGTTYEFDWAGHTAAGHALEPTWEGQLQARTLARTTDIHGAPTATTAAMVSFRDWLLARARSCGRHVINATGGGILAGPGIEQQSLAALAEQLAPPPVMRPAFEEIPNRVLADAAPQLLPALRELRDTLASGGRAPVLTEWTTFAGDQLDSATLQAAIVEASTTFQSEPISSPRAGGSPPTSGDALAWSIVPVLPEAIGRLRVALSGRAPGPAPVCIDPAAALAAAFDLLIGLQRDAAGMVDLLEPGAGDDPHLPIGLFCLATEPLTWTVRTFEGLLGLAWADTSAVSRSATATLAEWLVPGTLTPCASDAAARHRDGVQVAARLAMEWLRCAASHGEGCSRDAANLLAVWHRVAYTGSAAAACEAGGRTVRLVLDLRTPQGPRGLELPVPATDPVDAARMNVPGGHVHLTIGAG